MSKEEFRALIEVWDEDRDPSEAEDNNHGEEDVM